MPHYLLWCPPQPQECKSSVANPELLPNSCGAALAEWQTIWVMDHIHQMHHHHSTCCSSIMSTWTMHQMHIHQAHHPESSAPPIHSTTLISHQICLLAVPLHISLALFGPSHDFAENDHQWHSSLHYS